MTEPEIASLFDIWAAALKTGNAETVNELYAPNAVLLPTLSNKPRTDSAGRIDYFEHFLLKKTMGTIVSRNIIFSCDEATDVGVYNFDLTDPKTGKVCARGKVVRWGRVATTVVQKMPFFSPFFPATGHPHPRPLHLHVRARGPGPRVEDHVAPLVGGEWSVWWFGRGEEGEVERERLFFLHPKLTLRPPVCTLN